MLKKKTEEPWNSIEDRCLSKKELLLFSSIFVNEVHLIFQGLNDT
jgi:hypothetical protein